MKNYGIAKLEHARNSRLILKNKEIKLLKNTDSLICKSDALLLGCQIDLRDLLSKVKLQARNVLITNDLLFSIIDKKSVEMLPWTMFGSFMEREHMAMFPILE